MSVVIHRDDNFLCSARHWAGIHGRASRLMNCIRNQLLLLLNHKTQSLRKCPTEGVSVDSWSNCKSYSGDNPFYHPHSSTLLDRRVSGIGSNPTQLQTSSLHCWLLVNEVARQ